VIRSGPWLVAVAAVTVACGGRPPESRPTPLRIPDTTVNPIQVPSPPPSPAVPIYPRPAPPHARVRLAFVGDINIGTLSIRDGLPPDSGKGLLDRARPALVGDLVIGNFEGVLGDSGVTYKCGKKPRQVGFQAVRDSMAHPIPTPRRRRAASHRHRAEGPGCYAFLTPAILAPRLSEAGFTHLNLANNHSNDFGAPGRASTDSAFQALGIRLYGPLGSIAIDSVRHGDSVTVVGLIGFTTYPFAYDLLDIEQSAAVIDSLRPLVDLLLVTFHGGTEGVGALHTSEVAESLGQEPRGDLRHWAHAVIDAGADAVIGHGPHVLRGIEFYRGIPVVYSLGNFLTYRGFNLSGPLGTTAVLQLEYGADRKLDSARLVPMVQVPLRGPRPDRRGVALTVVRRLSQEDFGEGAALVTPDGRVSPRQ
jgi:hypothetical protein